MTTTKPKPGLFARAALPLMMLISAPAFAQADRSIDVNGAAAATESRSRMLQISTAERANPRKLDTKLQIAAGEVCGKWSQWGVRVPADYTRCYEGALSSARAQVNGQSAMAGGVIRIGAM